MQFEKIDPLGDGLGDEIAAEQAEPEAIDLYEEPTADGLQALLDDAENDPEYSELMRSIDE